MELIALRLFDHIAESGSFTAAATHFRLAVSTVSRQIGALEEEVGQRLLYRHTRAVSLTESGRLFHEDVREALRRLDQAAETVASQQGRISGLLRVNAPVAFGRRHFVPFLTDFQTTYPALKVDLVLSDAFIDPIQGGTDVTLRVGTLADSTLAARQLAPLHFKVCATPDYLDRFGVPRSPADLAAHNCLVYRGTRGLQYWYLRARHTRDWQAVSVNGDLHCNDADALLAAGLAHRGLMMFPTWVVHRELCSGALQPVLDEWDASTEPTRTAIHFVFPSSRLRSPKVALFMDAFREYVGETPYWDEGC
ncbi:LysR family transcriptional regulator [Pseudomonas sp. Marseille-QA0892]